MNNSPAKPGTNLRPAAFLDRDGVLNLDTSYVHDTDTAEIVEGAIEAVRKFKAAGYLVIVVSNQSGVARGYFNEEAVENFNRWLAEQFASKGATIDAFYFCPHHPQHGEINNCECRKPKPGMLFEASSNMKIDLSSSFLIGDRQSDMAAAKAASIPGFLFKGGNLEDFVQTLFENEHIKKYLD